MQAVMQLKGKACVYGGRMSSTLAATAFICALETSVAASTDSLCVPMALKNERVRVTGEVLRRLRPVILKLHLKNVASPARLVLSCGAAVRNGSTDGLDDLGCCLPPSYPVRAADAATGIGCHRRSGENMEGGGFWREGQYRTALVNNRWQTSKLPRSRYWPAIGWRGIEADVIPAMRMLV